MSICEAEDIQEFNCALDSMEIDQRRFVGLADIPEYRKENDSEQEYKSFPEEKIWSPKNEVNGWVPFYMFMARSALTFAQENQGIPNKEAMENSCTDEAEQYITDVLYHSEYILEVALKTLLVNELPEKVITRWTFADSELFITGIMHYGKNFMDVHKNFLPHKTMKDIVDFYYKWKSSAAAKQLRDYRCQSRIMKTKHRFSSIGHVIGDPASSKMITRSISASWKKHNSQENLLKDKSLSMNKRKRNSFCFIR